MNTKDWKRVVEIVSNALALDGAERHEYVSNEYAEHPELKDEIESLLIGEDSANEFFEAPAALTLARFLEEPPYPDVVGKTIGHYRLIRELGMGGMGAVFLAERIDGAFDRQVAVKMLRREFNTEAVRQRFEHEKEIQAGLIHPNIVHLVDAGSSEDGIPYLVMEYVDGAPVTHHCAENKLDLRSRLKLFNKICDAVAFAHRHLVIHRDLKPSNILVTADGEPKLLDFGISKLFDGSSGEAQTVTRLGAMTPEYASPEQVAGKSVTTSTDIYSLGVILFELVTGARPFERDKTDDGDILKAIREEDPPKPSQVLSSSEKGIIRSESGFGKWLFSYTDRSADTSSAGGPETEKNPEETTPGDVTSSPRMLEGDIDNIVLKALSKDPERRYQNADDLSADVWRHLDGLPVNARPATLRYRAGKFVARHRPAVLAGSLVLLALIAGLSATLWQNAAARSERARAERRFEQVRALANSLLFEIDPEIENLPGSTKARKLVVSSSLKYLDNLYKEAGNDRKLKEELATAYEKVGDVQGNPFRSNLGDRDGALQSYRKAQEIRQELFAADPSNEGYKAALAANQGLVGDIYFWSDEIADSERAYLRAIELWNDLLDSPSAGSNARYEHASVTMNLGTLSLWKGDPDGALKSYESSLGVFESLSARSPDHVKYLRQKGAAQLRIAEALAWQEKQQEASERFRIAVSILEPLAAQNPNDVRVQGELKAAYLKYGEHLAWTKEYDRGIVLLSKGVGLSSRAVERDPEDEQAKRDLSIAYNKLGEAFNEKGDGVSAVKNFRNALEIQRRIYADLKPADGKRLDIANTLKRLGDGYATLRDHARAAAYFEESLGVYRQLSESDPDNTIAQRGIAVAGLGIGENKLLLADRSGSSGTREEACSWLTKSREVFSAMESKGTLPEFDRETVKDLDKKLAVCRKAA